MQYIIQCDHVAAAAAAAAWRNRNTDTSPHGVIISWYNFPSEVF